MRNVSRLTSEAKGVYVIAVTPFTDNGALDLGSIDRLVDFYRAAGADGLTVLGMMGEAPKLAAEESKQVVKRFVERAGNLPVVVGVSAPGLAAMQDLTETAMGLGVAGVMVAPPASLKTDDQFVNYYKLVGETLGDVPLVVQDFPLGTGAVMSNSVLLRIFASVPSVAMLKHEDWPGLGKISALREAEKTGARRVSILTGNGGIFLPEELRRGANGAMTGFAYPEMMAGVCARHAKGDPEGAADLFSAYLPLVRYEQQPGLGLAVRKYVLAKRGAMASATLRRPGQNLSPADIADIERLIARQERRLKELG
jgi:4-hydroxy-tetrahydrodipicolinate synthase